MQIEMETIPLGNHEFEGKNNAYLLTGSETILVDTGIATSETENQLREGVAEHGIGFEEIDRVFLTHWHPDHAGLAGRIQRESGATVYAHEADAPIIRQKETALAEMRTRQEELFKKWGMPAEEREGLLDHLDRTSEIAGEPVEVTPIADGDRISIAGGGTELSVLHAPGHTAGQCCFAFTIETPQAFGGDAMLPEYTPNVGGADVRVDRPLERYLDALERIIDRGFETVWPGHRDPITDPSARAMEIIDHHHDRTARVIEVLKEQETATAWEVSAALFGDLSGIHVMHGPGEAYAHLDDLERRGSVTNTAEGYALESSVTMGRSDRS